MIGCNCEKSVNYEKYRLTVRKWCAILTITKMIIITDLENVDQSVRVSIILYNCRYYSKVYHVYKHVEERKEIYYEICMYSLWICL